MERTLIQANAEDAPRSHGAPGRLGRADGRSINPRGPIRQQEACANLCRKTATSKVPAADTLPSEPITRIYAGEFNPMAASTPIKPAFKPFVPATESRPELTARALILGAFFGVVFGAVTVYVGLRAGLTVAASIPISVFDHDPAGVWQGQHPGKQHRADHGKRGPVDRLGRHLHAARAGLSRLRS